MSSKTSVAILFGGPSPEHEISVLSARNVYDALSAEKYERTLIAIDPSGNFRVETPETLQELTADRSNLRAVPPGEGECAILKTSNGPVVFDRVKNTSTRIDVALPILHGNLGEDGCIQGVFRCAGLPFVGPDVRSSAVCMDKDLAKRILESNGIPVAPFETLDTEVETTRLEQILEHLGSDVFIKPANAGSSIGIQRARSLEELKASVSHAFRFDSKVLIEKAVPGRELECAVLGNANPQASTIGEIVASEEHGFYSYDAKYIDENGAALHLPAELTEQQRSELQKVALQAFAALDCEGMARVDMFLTADGSVFLNEINTIPGFTNISMYPKLWELSGIPYGELLDTLISLALQREQARAALQANFPVGSR